MTVIGEGGSGGALAIAIGDVTLMLQYATYSVISPEGCASILWKSAEHAREAAETLGITAPRLKTAGPHRQGRQRAARRRASRSRGDDGRRSRRRSPKPCASCRTSRSTRCSKRARTSCWAMASSRNSPRLTPAAAAPHACAPLTRSRPARRACRRRRAGRGIVRRVAPVALSGGRDSMALLDAPPALAASRARLVGAARAPRPVAARRRLGRVLRAQCAQHAACRC